MPPPFPYPINSVVRIVFFLKNPLCVSYWGAKVIGHRFSPQAAWFPAEGALVGSAPCAGSSHGEAQTSWGLWSSLLGREDNLSKLCFKVYFHSFFFFYCLRERGWPKPRPLMIPPSTFKKCSVLHVWIWVSLLFVSRVPGLQSSQDRNLVSPSFIWSYFRGSW